MDAFFKKLKSQAEENPIMALAIGVGCITAVTKLIDTFTSIERARTQKREINRRIKKNK